MTANRHLSRYVLGLACCWLAAVSWAESPSTAELPVLSEGTWKGQHAVYECESFRATMDSRGTLHVQVLDDGKPVGKPFPWGVVSCHYRIPKTLNTPSRPIVHFDDPTPAAMQPERIVLRGMLKDDVPFIVEYRFKGNTITASGGCDDPKKIEFPSSFRLTSSFPSNWSIHPYVPQTEREKLLAGCYLILREQRDGKTETTKNPYWEVMRFRGTIRELEIAGVYGRRSVTMTPKHAAGLGGHLSPGYCPWSGFAVTFPCPNDSLSPCETLVLAVE